MLLLTGIVTWSCTEDVTSSPDSVSMFSTKGEADANEGTRNVTIFTTCAWEATGDGWITVSPDHGDAEGIYEVSLTYGANTTGAERVGTVTFKAGTYTETYTLTQKAE